MTKRAWILVLEAGLCSSLSACTAPAKIGGGEQIAHAAESDMTPDIFDQPSPYAVMPRKEKSAKPKSVVSTEALASRSPYAALSQPIESVKTSAVPPPEPPPPEPPPPEPPPPEPRIPTVEASSTPVNATNVRQVAGMPPERPPAKDSKASQSAHQVMSALPNNLNASSPYAEIKRQTLQSASPVWPGPASTFEPASPYAATLHASSISIPAKTKMMDNLPPSPYTTISGQPITISAGKVSKQESLSPYAPTQTEIPLPKKEARIDSPDISGPQFSPYANISSQPITSISSQPIAVSVGKLSKQESVSPYAPTWTEISLLKKEVSKEARFDSPDISTQAKSQPEEQVQPAKFPEQPEMHVIQDGSAPAPPQAELDVETESPNPEQPIARKGDEPAILTAMRCFLNKRPAEALTWLKRYDEPNQELLIRLMPLMNQLAVRDLTRSDAQKVIEIMQELNPYVSLPFEGDLVIGKLCLCKHIKAFGDYEPFPEDHTFQPRDLVWIYAEVRNFTSERRDSGNGEIVFETRLKTTARITNSAGNHEWSLDFDRRYGPDRSRTLRHDYWDNLSFNVPELPPGVYTLWLKVVDEPTGRFKEKPIDFQVVPPKGQ